MRSVPGRLACKGRSERRCCALVDKTVKSQTTRSRFGFKRQSSNGSPSKIVACFASATCAFCWGVTTKRSRLERCGIASRVLARTAAGNITLFAFDAGEELSEHTAPFDALVLTLSGALTLTIGGREVRTTPQSLVLMPANVPHAVHASESTRMLLIMLREHTVGE